MVRYCFVPNCSEKYKPGMNLTFHEFPTNMEMREKWLNSIGLIQLAPSKAATVCSKHFSISCYLRNIKHKRVLRRDAVPTVTIISLQDALKKKLITNEQPSTSNVFNVPKIVSSDSTSLQSQVLRVSKKLKLDSTHSSPSNTFNISNVTHVNGNMSRCSKNIELHSSSKTETQNEFLRQIRRNLRHYKPNGMVSPSKARHKLKVAAGVICRQKQTIKSLCEQKRRLTVRINNLKSVMKALKEKHNLSQNSVDI